MMSVEARSIFVGNLPLNFGKDDLRSLFQRFGPVGDVSIFHKSIGGNGKLKSCPICNIHVNLIAATRIHAFGFVEYPTRQHAQLAVISSPEIYPGLRVEVKEPRRNQMASNIGPLPSFNSVGSWMPACQAYDPVQSQSGQTGESLAPAMSYRADKSWFMPPRLWGNQAANSANNVDENSVDQLRTNTTMNELVQAQIQTSPSYQEPTEIPTISINESGLPWPTRPGFFNGSS